MRRNITANYSWIHISFPTNSELRKQTTQNWNVPGLLLGLREESTEVSFSQSRQIFSGWCCKQLNKFEYQVSPRCYEWPSSQMSVLELSQDEWKRKWLIPQSVCMKASAQEACEYAAWVGLWKSCEIRFTRAGRTFRKLAQDHLASTIGQGQKRTVTPVDICNDAITRSIYTEANHVCCMLLSMHHSLNAQH